MKKLALHWKILIGMMVGLVLGILATNLGFESFIRNWIKPFGDIFLNLLKLIAVPLIIGSLIKGVTDLKDISRLSSMGLKTFGIYLVTTAIAVSVGLLAVNLSKPGEFVYDHPFQWGSRRTGPDLAREGGLRSHDWHVRHLENPRQLIPQSIMPTYGHLLVQDIDFESIQSRVRAHAMIGVPYGEAVKDGVAPQMARDQARQIAGDLVKQQGYEGMETKKVIALTAYLQRLGTDLFKPADAPPPEAAVTAKTEGGTP